MVFGELGALGLVLPRVALEVGERVERRRREPGEEGQRADGEARQRGGHGSDRRHPPEPALVEERHVRSEPEDADDAVARLRDGLEAEREAADPAVEEPVRKSNVRVSKPKTPRARTPSTLALRRGGQNSK